MRKNSTFSKCSLLCGLLLWLSIPSWGQEQSITAVTWENDSFAQIFGPYTDRHYSQGARISFLSRDNEADGKDADFLYSSSFLNWLPGFGFEPERTKGGLLFGQEIYTPEVLATGSPFRGVGYGPNASSVQLNDRPYAGWLYLGFAFQRRGQWSDWVAVKDDFTVKLGVVGPEAQGKEVQTWFHGLFDGAIKPEGWHNQLRNEPGVVLHGQRSWSVGTKRNTTEWAADFIPSIGMDLGNVTTRGTLGALLRFGYSPPRDFETQEQTKTFTRQPAYGFYCFAGAEGWLVAHDIFLDGNSHQNSHSVTKRIAVAELKLGLGIRVFKHCEFIGTYVHRTREFTLQRGPDTYLSGTIQWLF